MPDPQPLTRQDALRVWRNFLPKTAAYAGTRNRVQPGHGNVSRLSAALRFRTLLEDEVVQDTLAAHGFEAAEKWLQEVCWRRYWKGWLERRPRVWTQWRKRVRTLEEGLPAAVLDRVRAVSAGESGVDCMDRIARELRATGYLHNHARMWWASFWIHIERLPWELGADFFFRHLLDADPASNTLSWRWVAGLQTPGKRYLVRLSNIRKYAPEYVAGNPAGAERLEDAVVTAFPVEESLDFTVEPPEDHPTAPQKSAGRTGLWLHPDDLTPETGPLAELAPVRIAAFPSEKQYRETYRLSEHRVESLHTALNDGLHRAAAHYGCDADARESADPVSALCEWARLHELQAVVGFAPMTGPVGDTRTRLERELSALGIRLTLVRRPSDALAFQNATAGFFPYWEKMSRHLRGDHAS